MQNSIPEKSSLFGLIRQVAEDTKTFIRQEAQLAKAEISENVARLGRNAVTLAAGGVVAYAGLIVFVIGLGWLLAWAFQQAGLASLFAGFVGLAAMGAFVSVIGGIMLLVAIKTISQQSLTPERTVRTLEKLRGTETAPVPKPAPPPTPAPSSAELQTRVEATETRLSDTLDELGRRVSLRNLKARAVQSVKGRPYYSSLAAMVAGFRSTFFIKRRIKRA